MTKSPESRRIRGQTIKPFLSSFVCEARRWVNLVFVPWIGITLVCVLASWYSLYVVGLDALLAPVLKAYVAVKPIFFSVSKAVSALIVAIWFNTFGKLAGWFAELFAFIAGHVAAYFSGLKAWSVKKLGRQAARFLVSITARFVAISVLMSILFGRERKSVKLVPRLLLTKLRKSWLGRAMLWWKGRSDRQKRLILGVVLCLILVFAGHAVLGFSILLFDLLWEIVLLLARILGRLWRIVWPLIMRFIPNFISNFVTRKVIPLFTDIVPVVRDDHRVMFVRFNLRQRFRDIKSMLYRRSRARRRAVRDSVRPYVTDRLRASKTRLVDAASNLDSKSNSGEQKKG